ncbi:hypothetical protein ACTFIV_011055 [Dictyostelium citrinum]
MKVELDMVILEIMYRIFPFDVMVLSTGSHPRFGGPIVNNISAINNLENLWIITIYGSNFYLGETNILINGEEGLINAWSSGSGGDCWNRSGGDPLVGACSTG